MRILLTRRNGGLGDVLCLIPALHALRAHRPAARIDLALPAQYAELLRGRIHGVQVLAWDHRKFRPRWLRLLAQCYDLVIDLAGPHGSGQPNRIDWAARRCGIELVHPVPRLPLTGADRAGARRWLADQGIQPGRTPLVCLHLKSARAAKDWPLDRFGDLARRLNDRDVQVVALESTLRLDTPGIVGAVGLPLPRVAAIIAASHLLVGPDSGPMHLAAAVGTPCLALFGPTDPAVILRHYGATHRAIRRDPVDRIPVDHVLQEVEKLLEPDAPTPAAGQGAHPQRPRPRTRKVLFISDRTYPQTLGGAEISMHLLLQRLARSGVQTATCAWRRHAGRQLAQVIRHHRPDWVFTQLRVAPNVVREAKRLGCRVALFVRSLPEHGCGLRRRGRHLCSETGGRADPLACARGCLRRPAMIEQRAMFGAADLVVCNSDYTRRAVERLFGKADPARRIVQYPLICGPRSPGTMRRRYLTVVRPGPGKGQRLFERLTRLLPGREFLAVGGGPLDVPWDRVAALPETGRMAEVYQATRILLQPAVDTQCFGSTVAEAAAFGVPSVVSAQGGLPEALGPGGVAVTEFQNPAAWAAAIAEVDAHYDEYAAAARKHADRFSSIDTLLDAIRSAEGASSAPASRAAA